MATPRHHDAMLRIERTVVALALVVLTLLSWLYLAALADAMVAMDSGSGSLFMALMPMGRWGVFEFMLCAAMWIVMMVAMMAPSAAPMLFAFHALACRRPGTGRPAALCASFLLGYTLVWSGFSLAAAALQWGLHEAAIVTDAMVSANRALDSAMLLLAGVWQFTPLKGRCLSSCRSPLGFLIGEWRDGLRGALVMGLRHGALCAGCCWALMVLLFVGGVMNLLWIAVLAAAVLAEKTLPFGAGIAKVIGVALCAAGAWLLVAA